MTSGIAPFDVTFDGHRSRAGISLPLWPDAAMLAGLVPIDAAKLRSDYGPDSLAVVGNIDLGARPVVTNPDGSISTVESMSFSEGGFEVLIPKVLPGPPPFIADDATAIAYYHSTGQFLGKFADVTGFTAVQAADRYAQGLHEAQAAGYDPAPPEIPLDRWGYNFGDSGRPTVSTPPGFIDQTLVERALEGRAFIANASPFPNAWTALTSKYPHLDDPPNFDLGTWPVILNPDGTVTGLRVTSYLPSGDNWRVIPMISAEGVLMSQPEAEGYFDTKRLYVAGFDSSADPTVVTALVNDIHQAQDNRYAWTVKGTGAPPANTVHTYTAAGTYTAVLTVVDTKGRPDWVQSAPITVLPRCLPRSSGEPLDAVVLSASKAIPLALTQRIATIHIDDCIAPFDGARGIPAGGGVVFGTIPGVTLNGVDRIPFCQDEGGSVGVGIQLTNAKSLRRPRADSA